eukprot:5191248-Pleurochrysis_carterae.AAC.1
MPEITSSQTSATANHVWANDKENVRAQVTGWPMAAMLHICDEQQNVEPASHTLPQIRACCYIPRKGRFLEFPSQRAIPSRARAAATAAAATTAATVAATAAAAAVAGLRRKAVLRRIAATRIKA